MLNRARGYIPPKSGDEGYPPHSLITAVLPVAAENQTAIAIFESVEWFELWVSGGCVITEPELFEGDGYHSQMLETTLALGKYSAPSFR
ncbi:hypothetical protein KCP77_19480 [Salmonella enterica subsp. enterica]|nr:hypothetical protein KCP77_19480 [Salmonella enterica subsp. enterica]